MNTTQLATSLPRRSIHLLPYTTIRFVALSLLAFSLLAQEPPKLAVPEAKRDAAGTVTLTCATPGVVIRYSIDGSDPGPKGGPYLAPIVLPAGGTVKARAYSGPVSAINRQKLREEVARILD